MESIILSNGTRMPHLIQGFPLICGLESITKKDFERITLYSLEHGIRGIDTSNEYGKSETFIADVIERAESLGIVNREEIFITSKIGNCQQIQGDMEYWVDLSLKTMKLDYLDLMLLHWPYPDYYIKNWKQLEKIYKKGKVKAIGIANCKQYHIEDLLTSGIEIIPHVMQFELHPFRTVPSLISYCRDHNMAIQAYSALCMWAPFVPENKILQDMAKKYDKSIAQIMLRWSIQMGYAPIFRSYSEKHIKETLDIFSFSIEQNDVELISALNIDFKYHPESLNCPGY